MRITYTSIFLLFISSVSWAQSHLNVEGKIISSADGQPVIGANILLIGTNNGTISDINGEFSLQINGKANQLKISSIGFVAETVDVNLVHNPSEIEIKLREDNYQLQGVEITGRREDSYKNDVTFSGTKVATPIKELPQSISYITKELITDQQAFRTGEVVKNISGINQFSGYDDFTLRGFRSSNQLINGL